MRHVVMVNAGGPASVDCGRQRYSSRCLLPGSVIVFPAEMPYASRWLGIRTIAIEIDPSSLSMSQVAT